MALIFNGTSDKLLASSAALSGVPGTIAAWVRPDTTNADRTIAGLSNSGANQQIYRIHMTAAGVPAAQIRNDANEAEVATGTTTLSTTSFQHVCATFASDGAPEIFYNGASEATGVAHASGVVFTLNQTEIGVLQRNAASLFWDGDIAEVGFWNAVLDDSEIAALADGYSPMLIRPGSLKVYTSLLRSVVSVKGPVFTVTGTAAAIHPRVMMPRRRQFISAAAAAGGGFQAARGFRATQGVLGVGVH